MPRLKAAQRRLKMLWSPQGRPVAPALTRGGGSKAEALLCCPCLKLYWVFTVVPGGRFRGRGSSHSTSGASGGDFIFPAAWLLGAFVFSHARGFLEPPAAPKLPRHEGGAWTLQLAFPLSGWSDVQS